MSNHLEKCTRCEFKTLDFTQYILDDDNLADFLIKHGVISAKKLCSSCREPCRLVKVRDSFVYRCRRRHSIVINKKRKKTSCEFMQSVRNNTFFSGSKLPMRDICLFIHYEMIDVSPNTESLKKEFNCCFDTVINWRHYLREVFVEWAANYNCGKLGGPGRTVEIHEMMVSKRKLNRGKLIDGQWVLAAFERDSKKLYIKPIKSGTKDELLELIQDKIEDGTTIISDSWSSYNFLYDEELHPLKANHLLRFVAGFPKHVENTSKYARKDLEYFSRFVFKERYSNYEDRLHAFFTEIAKLFDPNHEEVDTSLVNNDCTLIAHT